MCCFFNTRRTDVHERLHVETDVQNPRPQPPTPGLQVRNPDSDCAECQRHADCYRRPSSRKGLHLGLPNFLLTSSLPQP